MHQAEAAMAKKMERVALMKMLRKQPAVGASLQRMERWERWRLGKATAHPGGPQHQRPQLKR